MKEKNPKEEIIESTKEVLKDVYNDLAKPTLKSLGSIMSLPFKAIDVALNPLKKWIDKKTHNYEKTRDLLAEKLKKIKEDDIVEPESYVAVPALEQLSYSYDSEDLRELYANLLASAMIENTKWDVHPSFVEIIKQLSPSDAKTMKALSNPSYFHPILVIARHDKKTDIYYDDVMNYNPNLLKNYKNHQQLSASLINLQRLGLISLRYDVQVSPDSEYEPFIEDPINKFIIEQFKDDDTIEIVYKKGLIELTDFGMSFCKICCEKEEEEEDKI